MATIATIATVAFSVFLVSTDNGDDRDNCVCRACEDFGITGCNLKYARDLEARKLADETLRPDYQLSCSYLQQWSDCLAPKKVGCRHDNNFLMKFSRENTRLSASPYNCRLSGAMSPMASFSSLVVALLLSMTTIRTLRL